MTQKNPMGLGKDPLDTLLPDAIQVPSKENPPDTKPTVMRSAKRKRETAKTTQKRAGKPPTIVELDPEVSGPKVTVSLHLPLKLIERVRDAAYYVPGLTISGIAETALINELQHLDSEYEKTYHQTIPKRTGKLSPGRPPKS